MSLGTALADSTISRSARRLLKADSLVGETILRTEEAESVLQFFKRTIMNWMTAEAQAYLKSGSGNCRAQPRDGRAELTSCILNESILRQGFPMQKLLKESQLSKIHLDRIFLREFGLTPHKYWERRRLNVARDILETASMSIKELSWHLGFSSSCYFVAWFRRLAGTSPKQYKQKFLRK
jgi:transcriptional regulator GlxA family with amidase domain